MKNKFVNLFVFISMLFVQDCFAIVIRQNIGSNNFLIQTKNGYESLNKKSRYDCVFSGKLLKELEVKNVIEIDKYKDYMAVFSFKLRRRYQNKIENRIYKIKRYTTCKNKYKHVLSFFPQMHGVDPSIKNIRLESNLEPDPVMGDKFIGDYSNPSYVEMKDNNIPVSNIPGSRYNSIYISGDIYDIIDITFLNFEGDYCTIENDSDYKNFYKITSNITNINKNEFILNLNYKPLHSSSGNSSNGNSSSGNPSSGNSSNEIEKNYAISFSCNDSGCGIRSFENKDKDIEISMKGYVNVCYASVYKEFFDILELLEKVPEVGLGAIDFDLVEPIN